MPPPNSFKVIPNPNFRLTLSRSSPRARNLLTKASTTIPNPCPRQIHHPQSRNPRRSSPLLSSNSPAFPFPLPTQYTQSHNRLLSTSPQTSGPPPTAPHIREPTPLSTEEYHALSDAYIDNLVSQLETLAEERSDVDVEYSAGVLTLTIPPHGTYVLNKQPPNKQIWLSSPVSGPKRYDWVAGKTEGGEAPEGGLEEGKEGEWVYLRDGSTLRGLLGEEVGVEMEGWGEGEGG